MGHLFQMLVPGLAGCLVLARKHQILSNSVATSENQGNSGSHEAGHLMRGLGKDISVSKLHIAMLNSYVLCFKKVLLGTVQDKRI